MQAQHQSKTRILDAALQVFRSKGYAGSTIDDVCEEADLTKGSFFHHFKTKEELAVAAAQHFSDGADALFCMRPTQSFPIRLTGFLPMSISAAPSCRANCATTPVSSARWCRNLRNPPGDPRRLRASSDDACRHARP